MYLFIYLFIIYLFVYLFICFICFIFEIFNTLKVFIKCRSLVFCSEVKLLIHNNITARVSFDSSLSCLYTFIFVDNFSK